MEAAITDDLLDAYALAGDREEIRDGRGVSREVCDTIILEPPRWQLSQEQILARHRDIIEAIA